MPAEPDAPATAVPSLGPDDRAAVMRLATDVAAEDGAPPLSDQALAQLGSAAVTHLVIRDAEGITGYAQVDPASVPASMEIAARPDVLEALLAAAPADARVWSHGHRSRLRPALEAGGYRAERELHQLRRDAGDLPPDPPLRDGIAVRAFRPGEDDAAWLAVNAAAFASHPEQGRWTQADLDARKAEEWFDPAGFLLAGRDGELLGFHWTKVHPDGLGEVYVLGVSPAAQGLGLGSALLYRGLHHLESRGCPQTLLYVDGDNPGALHLYERSGFRRYDLDVQWARA